MSKPTCEVRIKPRKGGCDDSLCPLALIECVKERLGGGGGERERAISRVEGVREREIGYVAQVLLRADEVMTDVVADFRTPAAVHGRFLSWQR